VTDPAEDLRADRGHDFVLAVCDAIETAVGEWTARDPDAFLVGASRLDHAVELELFIHVVNRWDLHAAYAEGTAASMHARDALEQRVLQLVAARCAGRVDIDIPHESRSFRRSVRRALSRVRPTRVLQDEPVGLPQGAVACFVFNHPKFVRYTAPLIRHLGVDRCMAIALAGTEEAVEGLGIPAVPFAPTREGLAGEYEHLHALLEATRPRVVVIVEGNAPIHEVANQAAHDLGIATLCIQQGWASMVHTGFRNMSFDSMAVWGRGFAALLEPHNPHQHFDVTGSLSLDPGFDESAPVPEVNRPAVLFALQVVAPTIPYRAIRSFLSLIDDVAERLPQAALLVREHPGHPIAAQGHDWTPPSRVQLVPPDRFPLRAVLDAVDVVVSISSTTLLEGVARLRPAVVVNETSVPRHSPDVEAWNAGVEVATTSDAVEAICRLVENHTYRRSLEPGMKAFRAEYFAGADEPGIANVAAVVERLAR
jgi:hypothetical protein